MQIRVQMRITHPREASLSKTSYTMSAAQFSVALAPTVNLVGTKICQIPTHETRTFQKPTILSRSQKTEATSIKSHRTKLFLRSSKGRKRQAARLAKSALQEDQTTRDFSNKTNLTSHHKILLIINTPSPLHSNPDPTTIK